MRGTYRSLQKIVYLTFLKPELTDKYALTQMSKCICISHLQLLKNGDSQFTRLRISRLTYIM